MAFADVEAKTMFVGGFSPTDTGTIIDAMRTAYDRSPTAHAMFDNFIAVPGNLITITPAPPDQSDAKVDYNHGFLSLDLSSLADNTYITPTGEAVAKTALSLVVHELGHALAGYTDDSADDYKTDYKGPNVTFVNNIYHELGIPELVSYIAQDDTGQVLIKDFEYTNGATIDRAFCGEFYHPITGQPVTGWDSSPAGNSRDLLIGGTHANTLHGGAGDDFLFGGRGDDDLYGDADNDIMHGDDLIEKGNDAMHGGDGNDTLYGDPGNDTLEGGPGDDTLDGGPDDDTYWGGLGKDVYGPIIGHDTIMDFVAGEDTVTLAEGTYVTFADPQNLNEMEIRQNSDDSLVGIVTFVNGISNAATGAEVPEHSDYMLIA